MKLGIDFAKINIARFRGNGRLRYPAERVDAFGGILEMLSFTLKAVDFVFRIGYNSLTWRNVYSSIFHCLKEEM